MFGIAIMAMTVFSLSSCQTDTPESDEDDDIIVTPIPDPDPDPNPDPDPTPDPDPNPDPNPDPSTGTDFMNVIAKETGMRVFKVGGCEFYYDNKGKVMSLKNTDDSSSPIYYINWDKQTLTDPQPDRDDFVMDFKTNSDGFITELSYTYVYNQFDDEYPTYGTDKMLAKYSYDAEGHLIKYVVEFSFSGVECGEKAEYREDNQVTLKWVSGNLVAISEISTDSDNGKTKYISEYNYNIAYGSAQNKYRQWSKLLWGKVSDYYWMGFVHVGMFGVGTANFPTKVWHEVVEQEDGEYKTDSSEYDVEIMTNANDLISTEKLISEFDGDPIRHTYESINSTRSAGTAFAQPGRKTLKHQLPKRRRSIFPRLHKARK